MPSAMTIAYANCLDAERSMDNAPEPLIMMAKQMAIVRM
jgi:hypothetical protein